MSYKPSIPKGTRDFAPAQMARRNFIFDTIKAVFKKYGYQPIETPAMENLETLTGKYGEEGDRLIFKILKRGASFDKALAKAKEENETVAFSEEALRYDLTVPFARFVVQHQNELNFPFKRYQIQPVWRADRPQRGRYREFYQCDVDSIGSNSLLNEVELIQIMDEVFTKLGIKATIKLNNRKVLQGICESIGLEDRFIDITIGLDKLDKIGENGVKKELSEKGLSDSVLNDLMKFFAVSDSTTEEDTLKHLTSLMSDTSEIGKKGLEELSYIFKSLTMLNLHSAKVKIDPTLARGLNYYTGAIFEVVCNDFPSSICGGGRYDDLTGIFGLKDVSGVGISFGADRIYDVMEEQHLFPKTLDSSLDVLFINFGEKEAQYCLHLATQLRDKGYSVEVYPDSAKMKKQMKYADGRNVRKVVMIGSQEMEAQTMSVKDMASGDQKEMNLNELIQVL